MNTPGVSQANAPAEEKTSLTAQTGSRAVESLSSSPLYQVISAYKEDSKANVCEENNDAYQDEASNDITLASVGVSVDHSHDGEEREGETFQLQFKPWKHTRQRATGRRVFGGWSSKQPFRVGVGGRSSSAPPLAPERSGVERAPTNALAVASSQKRLRKMTRKKMTKKRQSSRR